MAGLCWMAVVLAFSTSIGNSLAVDQRSLTVIVGEILDRYFMNNMQFSLAVNIPVDQKIKEALDKDPSTNVQNKVRKGEVYTGTNVVAATFQKKDTYTDHAEARVLDKIKPLVINSKGHILVLYSYLSPCGQKCTNQNHNYNILDKINSAIKKSKWADRAFVFTKVFDGRGITQAEIKETFNKLAGTQIGQNNIFRCYYPKKGQFQCIKCFNNGVLSDECVQN
ncbi:uncharacterized protein LOC126389862 [Epinephelus moara]|uniref:uncharacterized protein LOC126389862 n=1 Tax=Epinephelus moara TaxID=300413 RepID=UPI00214E2F1C|nr:uncharacterized protein LOC126389862 [Epinephelus moara]